jgi:flagellar export protein FliJ
MSTFAFRLDRLLAVRAAVEQLRAGSLGVATSESEQCRARHAERCQLVEDAGRQIADQRSAALPAGLHVAYSLSLQASHLHADATGAALDAAELRKQEALDAFTNSRVARRSIERLRERHEEAWKVEENRTEQAALDEMASRSHARGAA